MQSLTKNRKYAILQNPGHNRVYFKTARALALLELEYAGAFAEPHEEIIGGLAYILFETDAPADMLLLSRLSFTYGIFEWDGKVLLPLKKDASYFFENDDITSILKYNGKTNELFTRMLLNISVACGGFGLTDRLSVLDPLCGKGTTLYEALLCGYNAAGVETDSKILAEASTFLKRYLETARCKHTLHQERQGMKGYTAHRHQFKLSRGKTDTPIEAELISGDTRDVSSFFRKSSFDIILGDLPYGVQHGSKSSKSGKNSPSRNALPLLTEALPSWHKALKPGGVLTLAWNLFLIERAEMENALTAGGFALSAPQGSTAFVHRVDQAINRDVIIAKKI